MTVVVETRRDVHTPGHIGTSTQRADGVPKVKGEFAYASDMRMEGMLHGATLRSPHPRADIWGIDVGPALAIPGVHAVLTHADVPGRKTYGMEIADQPVLAIDHVRYQGEPVAIVAADHPETARRAAAAIEVEYDVLEPLTDAERALSPDAPPLHLSGNVLRHMRINHGDPEATADVVVTGEYEVGMQDQAFLGPESGLAVPDGEGGVDLYIATQWLHVDHGQVAQSLGLPPEKVRLTLGGVGGAFGGREDLSMQIHACMLALHTGRPVRMAYNREESFYGHVHRHPCRMRYEHGATRDGRLVFVRARILLDGGAYASSSTAVCANAACFACGPYDVPNARVDSYVAYTNNPPCGAMRGFGAVQVAFAHEAQMDRLAAALGMDPVDLRIANAMTPDSRMPTGQRVGEPAPVAELLQRVRAMPMPPEQRDGLPGGIANVTHGEGVRRGVGYAVAMKNIGFSEGFDDYSTARVRLSTDDGEPLVEVHTAAAEVGQGIVTVVAQIARTELGVERVAVLDADTRVGSAGSSSASRQTYVTGGAVKAACEAVRERWAAGEPLPIEETVEWRHKPTFPLDENGQGDAHVQYAFSAHRAVVDVDTELGLVRVVELATAQEVGKAINPQALEGQIEGGSAQGLGLALMEEIQVRDGKVLNASFTDYLLPTILDMPPVRIEVLEHADPTAPYGLKGVGEPPNISTPPAIAAALRAATGRELRRIPARPEHIVGLGEEAFVASLDGVFEHSPWVARAAYARGPFAGLDELHAALVAVVGEAPRERQLELIRAHPELAMRAELSEASSREQASAGLQGLAADEADRWRALNAAYRERFGFPLVICVREHTRESMLAWGEERLRNDADDEVEIALGEIAKIARLRLEERR
ncbi:MAG TPA: 2-oxo-4-hydroxy-4-carboxy-5-ureidoimidazoline decarboxylase [Solirubrobacteraceae bacterium]|nr:2-oxo-4-hydroxy-4-carboxy-5-ureidoimidazoline decarboxylase [Solirubrobacteraceae bacterium]